MGDTKSIGVAFRDQDLDGSTLANATITAPTISSATMTGSTLTTTNVSGTTVSATNLTIAAGGNLVVDNANVSATGNDTTQTVTATKQSGIVTTGALTTAAAAVTEVVITLAGVVAGDVCLATLAGGTNTTPVEIASVVCTTNTITVTLRNAIQSVTALNGTVAFHYFYCK